SERKAAERLNQIPGGTGIVSGEEVRETRSADLRDVLQGQPGVYVSTRNGQEYRLSIRGSGLQRNYHLQGIQLLEDGMPVNLADGFGDFNMVAPTATEYTEIYRGSNGLEYGAASLGGAVNFVARTGRWAPAFDVRLEGGSWNYLSGQVAAARAEEDSDVYASYSHYSEDGYRAHSAVDNQHFAANAAYRFSPEWETRLYVNLVRTVSELPDVLTLDQVHHDPRFADPAPFGATAEDWHRDLDIVRVADKTSWRSGDQQVDLGVYWMLNDLFHPVFWMPGLNIGVVDNRTNDFGGFARYTNEQPISGMRNRIVAGAFSSGNRTLAQRFQNPDGKPGALTARGFQDAFNLSAYVQDQLWLSNEFSVVAGLQETYTTRTFTDRFLTDVDGDQSFYANYAAANPTAGARYQITPTSQVFGNVTRSFEPPQYIELTGVRFDPNGSVFYNPLRAQRATTAEIGTRGKEGRFAWELVYYHSWIRHEIISTNPFPFVQQISNAGRTKHEGVEFAADITVAEGVWAPKTDKKVGDRVYLRPVYTWNNFKFRNDPANGNNRLPAVPEHVIQAELGYEHPIGAFLAATLECVPSGYPIDYANNDFANADRYATWGLKTGYRPGTGVAFFVEVRNLNNQRYVNSADQVANAADPSDTGAHYHPAYARAYYAGLELRW
ncbi:MAG: TonB-dependent receptor, partial [Planctomycetaceae bacterium]|nr:TonB-dependent receptor [Planctomycetaceae bacterium]